MLPVASVMTSPRTHCWNVLRWHFDAERVDVIFGHNVEYRGSKSRLPILVLECLKGKQGKEGGMPERPEI